MDVNLDRESEDEPLVILPGLLCHGAMFAGQLSAFHGSRCIDGFYDGADRIEAMAEHVVARLPERCALLGHSMGARVALEVCRRAPGHVARLALADTGIHPVRAGEREKRYALRDLGRDKGFGTLVDAWLPPMIGPTMRDDAAFHAMMRAMCMEAGQAVFEAQIEALLNRPDVSGVLAAIDCPVALMVGAHDEWSSVEQHRQIATALGGARLTIVPDAGHMAPAERPDAFNRAVAAWLGTAPANTVQA